jgi:hypothetical protein
MLVCISNRISKGELVFGVQIIILMEPSLLAANYKDVKYALGSHIMLSDCPLTGYFHEEVDVCLTG